MRPNVASADEWPILVVDDELVVRELTRAILDGIRVDGVPVKVHCCGGEAEAQEMLAEREYAVAIIDLVMETSRSGVELIAEMHRRPRHRLTQIVVRTGDASVAPEPELVRRFGIADYWHKGGVTPRRMQTLVTGLVRAHATARSLQIEKRYLRTLLHHLPNTVLHVDEAGMIDYRNRMDPGGAELWHPGTSLERYLSEKSMDELRGPLLQACRGEPTSSLDLRVGELSYEARLGPSPDGTRGAVLILTDVTQRRAWEESVVTAGKLDVVARMAGGVAHELNNSLTAVLTSVAMAHDTVTDRPATARLLQASLAAAERMRVLSKDLLHLTDEQGVDGGVLDLVSHLRSRERMCRTLVGERVNLTLRLPAGLLPVRASRDHVDQILWKLLVHCAESMPGGGEVLISTDAVNLRMPRGDDAGPHIPAGPYVRVLVEDNGPGLSREERRHLFDPFSTETTRGEPSGLGLSVVYLGVRRLGGSIWVNSAPGRGTRFQVMLPLASPAAVKLPEAEAPEVGAQEIDGGGRVVLLVEDDPQVMGAVGAVLRKSGYEVVEARDVTEAMVALDRDIARIDLLLSDVRLPDGNGFDVLRRARELRPTLPVLMTSGYAGYVHEARTVEHVHFLRKPYLPRDLLWEVSRVMDAEE